MKWTSSWLLAGILVVAGCAFDSGEGGDPEESIDVSDGENLGSVSHALIAGTWLQTILAPDTPVKTSSGAWVCRAGPSAAFPNTPGWLDGNTCRYANSSSGWWTTDRTLLVNQGYAWIDPYWPCGRGGWCMHPSITKIVGNNGYGICQVKLGDKWYSGRYSAEHCYTPIGTTYGQPGTERRTPARSDSVSILIKP